MPPELQWGLLAIGRSGQTQIDVDQTCVGEDLFELEISKPGWSLRCRISQPGIIETLASFLADKRGDSMAIGTLEGIPVEVRRDPEFGDRFFLVVGALSGRIELTVAGESEVSDLSKALLQAAEDLK
jgi:hypothetical protein